MRGWTHSVLRSVLITSVSEMNHKAFESTAVTVQVYLLPVKP